MKVTITAQFDDPKKPCAEDITCYYENSIEHMNVFKLHIVYEQSIPNGEIFLDYNEIPVQAHDVAKHLRFAREKNKDLNYLRDNNICGFDVDFEETLIKYPWHDC